MVYIYVLTLRWNLGYTGFNMSKAMLPAMGMLFFFIGYLMRKAKRNFFIGIRTPWTLSSDRVWDETHRVGSVLFMIAGVLAFLGSFVRRDDRLLVPLRADHGLDAGDARVFLSSLSTGDQSVAISGSRPHRLPCFT